MSASAPHGFRVIMALFIFGPIELTATGLVIATLFYCRAARYKGHPVKN